MTEALPTALHGLRSEVDRLIEADALGAAMDLVRAFVDRYLNNPRATARVLASADLDGLCRWIGSAVRRRSIGDGRNDRGRRAGTLILATELVMAGGHVELIKDFVKLRLFEPPVRIVLTDCFGRADAGIAARFAESEDVRVTIAQGRNTSSRFASVMREIELANPSTLVIVTNNQDTIGICAALATDTDRTVFIHHGDHHLCLGVTCDEFIHVDLANIAFNSCRHTLGVAKNVYWPLVLRESISPRPLAFDLGGGIVSCAVGRPEKFDARSYAFDYVELLPEMIKATGGRHVHIGNVPDEMYRRLQKSFDAQQVDFARLKFVPWVPSVARALVEENVDLLIGSFPFGGGKSTIEAMAAGVPLLMHLNYRHRMYCGADVAYQGALRWSRRDELFTAIAGLTPEILEQHSRLARAWFEKHHAGDALVRAAAQTWNGTADLPPPLGAHPTDELLAFIDEERALVSSRNSAEVDRAVAEEASRKPLELIESMAARIAFLENERRSTRKLFFRYLEVAWEKIKRKTGLQPRRPS
jgi:hypothetical protein